MGKPMFFFTGVHDNVADADAALIVVGIDKGGRAGRLTIDSAAAATRPND